MRILELQPAKDLDWPLQARLAVKCLTYVPDYDALSYTWEPTFEDETLPEQTLHILDPDGKAEYRLEITGNLACALRRLRYQKAVRLIWADAVCIDQSNAEEKSKQVAMMASIYLTANAVLVWLGEDSKGGDGAFAWDLAYKASPDRQRKSLKDFAAIFIASDFFQSKWGDHTNQEDLARRFVSRRHFHRRWIVQEIFYGADITVICGDLAMKFTALVDVSRIFSEFFETVSDPENQQLTSCSTRFNAVALRKETTESGFHHGIEFMCMFQELQCHDARDRVYALASL